MKDHRGNPGCYVLQPSDAFAAYALTNVMAEYEGVCYMRTLRADTELIYNDDVVFNLGGFEVLSEGKDIVICASGYMVHEANKAPVQALYDAGVKATLVDLYSSPSTPMPCSILSARTTATASPSRTTSAAASVRLSLTHSWRAATPSALKQMHVNTRIPKSLARTPGKKCWRCAG